MDKFQRRLVSAVVLLGTPFIFSTVYAAKPIDLSQQSTAIIKPYTLPGLSTKNAIAVKETSRSVDLNNTTHVRIQETFSGYTVYGADAVVHIPSAKSNEAFGLMLNQPSTMNGIIYEGLNADLNNAPKAVFTKAQAEKALTFAVKASQVDSNAAISEKQSDLIVFVDDNNKAHWAYKISFYVSPEVATKMPQRPVYIIDAVTFKVYRQWNDIQTIDKASVKGGGFGGNIKMGKLNYDDLDGDLHLGSLTMQRDADKSNCSLKNDEVIVNHYRTGKNIGFACKESDVQHGYIYWNGDFDAVNDGYGPANDALFGGKVIKNMYQKWYNVPVLTENGKPMTLVMVVHDPIDNAFWDGRKMTFGDGVSYFYPLTSLGVAAHEISHGFTQQHSNLSYWGQSGGMNESFSDMAAQAAEFYAYGKNSWQIGPEIFKEKDKALRYMDQPSKDCYGKTPGNWCSIDNVSQYRNGIDVHFSSGIYNRLFYLMGTADGWDTRKAFDVMVHANQNYWTSNSTFQNAACGVLKATADLKYDATAVKNAITTVGLDPTKC